MSLDTALKKNQRADYSAFTTWGVFKAEDQTTGKTINNIILLSAYKARLEFPELKRKVRQFYDEDQPDTLLIEDKGSGISLIQELRSMGIPVEAFSAGRGSRTVSNDKVARANMVSDIFASGFVWCPERRFAEELIEEAASFPHSEHDDLLDSTVQAMLRFRAGGFIRTSLDEAEDDAPSRYTRARMY
jgi:predicted phage terminase large subunit-like protein